jgi:membrane-associated protease RseP (regulator of RpoE activity)
MIKSLAFIAVGLILGVLLTVATRPSVEVDDVPVALPAVRDLTYTAPTVTPEDVSAVMQRMSLLEERVISLSDELAAFRDEAAKQQKEPVATARALPPLPDLPLPGGGRTAAVFAGGAPGQVAGPLLQQQLIDGGFTPARAEWIKQRADALALEQMQARYDAERNGQPIPPGDPIFGTDVKLHAELGDAEFEQYLTALGRPTTVSVFGVMAGSAAETAGIRPGDQLVSYAGSRVFAITEVNPLTMAGTPGESVVVEVQRDGQTLPLLVPRGPLGISGGSLSVNGQGAVTMFRMLGP